MPEQVPLQAVVAAFKTADGASRALAQLKGVNREALHVREAAVLVREQSGRLEIKESHHIARGAVVGGVVGAVVGVVAGPVGWVTVGGAAVGALANHLRDTGFPDARLRQIGQALTPGTSALVAIVEHRWVGEMERLLRVAEADVATEAMREEVAAQLERSGTEGSVRESGP